MQENKEYLQSLFNKINSFYCHNLNCIRFSLNNCNYDIFTLIVRHMNNKEDISEEWLEENIKDKENINYLKKLIKINTF